MNAPTCAEAEAGIEAFAAEYEAKYPKAVASLRRDQGQLLTFYDFPAEHWRHLRTTNVIESPFATVRLRQRVTKGAGSRTKALLMAFKLLAMAEERWRKVNGSELLPLVRAGVRFVDGVQEKPKTFDNFSCGSRSHFSCERRRSLRDSGTLGQVRRSASSLRTCLPFSLLL